MSESIEDINTAEKAWKAMNGGIIDFSQYVEIVTNLENQ